MMRRDGGDTMRNGKEERRHYSREFKLQAVKMMENRRPDQTVEDIAIDLGVHPNLLYKWEKKHEEFADKVFLKQDPLLQELEKLRRENSDLRVERDILKKALTIFSQPSKQ